MLNNKSNENNSIRHNFAASTQSLFIFCNFNFASTLLIFLYSHCLRIKRAILVILLFNLGNLLLFNLMLNIITDFLYNLLALLNNIIYSLTIKGQFNFLLLNLHAGPLC